MDFPNGTYFVFNHPVHGSKVLELSLAPLMNREVISGVVLSFLFPFNLCTCEIHSLRT
jgi:hypothetical protein